MGQRNQSSRSAGTGASGTSKKPKTLREALKGFEWHRAGLLVLATIFAIAFYYYMNIVWYEFTPYVVGAYVVGGELILAYFIYNRAFTGRGVTYEMLPDTMSDAEKKAYLADVAGREKKSRWMLMAAYPLIITLMIDLFKLFVIDRFLPAGK